MKNQRQKMILKKKYYFYITFQNKCGRLYVSIRGKADCSHQECQMNFLIILALKVFFLSIIIRLPVSFHM